MSTPAENVMDDAPSQGALAALASPEARQWSANYLRQHPQGVDTSGEEELLHNYEISAQEAKAALQGAREKLAAQRMDPRIAAYSFAQAMLAPAKYGLTSGNWANAAGSLGDYYKQQQALEQQKTLQDVPLAEQEQGLDQKVLNARLALQELKERNQARLFQTALQAGAKPAAESPIGKLVEDKLGAGSLQTAEGQKLFDAYQKQAHESKTPAPGAVDPTAIDFGAYKLYKTGQMPPLGMGGGPIRAAILAGAAQLSQREATGEDVSNPGYDQAIANGQDFTAANRALGSFAGGPLGNQTRALNNAVGHLKLFEDTFTALNNGDVQLLNRLGNAWSTQIGKPVPTTLKAMGTIVGPELTKILAGTNAGTGEERGQFLTTAGSLANSPEQTKSAIDSLRGMLGRQAADLALQYHGATGRSDFAKRYFAPDIADSLNLNPDTATQTSSSPVVVKSDEDYNKLPSGTLFVGPDGHTRKKP